MLDQDHRVGDASLADLLRERALQRKRLAVARRAEVDQLCLHDLVAQ